MILKKRQQVRWLARVFLRQMVKGGVALTPIQLPCSEILLLFA